MIYEKIFLDILEKEMVPALGCTDPVGVAYAAACAKKHVEGDMLSITGEISVNIIKNASAVCIPKTGGKCGVALALALGAVGGNSEKGLEVLSDIIEEDVKKAMELVNKGIVETKVSENQKKLYMKVTLKTVQDEASITIEDNYTNITSIVVNGKAIFQDELKEEHSKNKDDLKTEIFYGNLSLESILRFAETVSIDKLEIIQTAVKMNMAVAEEGLANDYGVSVGRSIQSFVETGKMDQGIVSHAMMWTAAATDARMAGCDIPVMSNTGSGNQGLASTIPVISIAKKMGVSYEKMIRAVTISSLVTIYIKAKLGALSAVCGAVIAGVGTSSGVVYLLDGTAENMLAAMQSTFGDVAGMICDGAKAGCALKVATCTNIGVFAALLAMENRNIKGTDGIVGYGETQTIDNFIKISTEGMELMDNSILEIILKKKDKQEEVSNEN